MIQLIICDDNPYDIEKSKLLIQKHLSERNMDYEILDFSSGESLIQACESNLVTPDIIFMDIELDGINGIEIVTAINRLLPNCHIIYATNYLQYATDVYTTEHRYYVLKPEFEKRLPTVFDKITQLNEELDQEYRIAAYQILCSRSDRTGI